ncbi:cation-translocating P-type ATPase [Synechococcus sp. RSCCF101]|uniref:cation-translocating P-type ATPase n=1 Tax=Synechococcus sp. RSCCF101 TaxID=2511069 RepID=UPI0012490885|nr:cation-translocating P-type ATPase [Synechococcus sp. RSCCF101]QEY31432.1 cation-translocating P-type ATPase [Synechococcus sp. RSCCF101]
MEAEAMVPDLADLADLAAQLLLAARSDGRRVWRSGSRLHAEARPPAAAHTAFAQSLRDELEGRSGVDWARWNADTARVVVHGPDVERDPQDVLSRIARLERALADRAATAARGDDGGGDGPGPRHRDHPADVEPILRSLSEIAVELVGTGAALALRSTPVATRLGIDLAVVLRVVESLPPVKASLERRLGPGAADLLLKLANAADFALLRGLSGALVSLLEEGLRLRGLLLRRRRWQLIEAHWNGRPDDHRHAIPELPERARPIPPGPIERHLEKSALLSFGAFGLGLASLGNVEGPAAALLAGLPRPALLSRSAFCLELGRRLEDSGTLLLDPEALERLDRIDLVLLDAPLLESVWGEALLAAIRQAGLEAVVARDGANDPGEGAGANGLRQVPQGPGSLEALRGLQAEGHTVMVLADGSLPALAAADLAVGIHRPGSPPPWHAHLLAPSGALVSWLLVPACATARECAAQGVTTAALDAVVGLTLCLDGLSAPTSAGVNQATNLLSLVAVANGLRLARSVGDRAPLPASDPIAWHELSVEEALEAMDAAAERESATPLLDGNRPREDPDRPASLSSLILAELDTPLTPILGTGAVLSGLVGAPLDAGLILGVLGLNAVVGGTQRLRVEQALNQLQDRHAAPVWVRGAAGLERREAESLRVGEVILVASGEVVPADCRLLSAEGLQVDESALTGESFPVTKASEACPASALADRRSMLHAGTTVVSGEASALVVSVGEATQAQRAAALIGEAGLSAGVEARLSGLTDTTIPVAAAAGVALLVAAVARGQDARGALADAVALTVAAVPEGLPLIAGLAQGAAARRLADHNVLVRQPRAIEALGRADVLCLDKTGTLTEGRIALSEVCDLERLEPLGRLGAGSLAVLATALRATPVPEPGKALAHPTDRALWEGAGGLSLPAGAWQLIDSLPFDPERGYHAGLGQTGAGGRQLCVKGSPEVLLAACDRCRRPGGSTVPLDAGERARVEALAREGAARGLRVLAVAQRSLASDAGEPMPLAESAIGGLELLGFVLLADPIRTTARQAVQDLRAAGMAVKVITGDHPATAAAVATELKLPQAGPLLTGPELERLDPEALRKAVRRSSVFARVTSQQKVTLVRALQADGRVVAMTGDGANDAPAIRLAEVGIALGEGATEAARRAADLVVTDGRIETIGRAVIEGRALWRSVRDAVSLLVGGNLGEIGFTAATALMEGRSALNTRQLLLVNLLTDVAPALTLAVRPPAEGDPAALADEGPSASLGRALDRDILRTGVISAAAALVARQLVRSGARPDQADTVGLLTLVASQLSQMAGRSGGDAATLAAAAGSVLALLGLVQVPATSRALGCAPLTGAQLLPAAAVTVLAQLVAVSHR